MLIGLSGLPSMLTIFSSTTCTSVPHPTAQYGQTEGNVFAFLMRSSCARATFGSRFAPSAASAPIAVPAIAPPPRNARLPTPAGGVVAVGAIVTISLPPRRPALARGTRGSAQTPHEPGLARAQLSPRLEQKQCHRTCFEHQAADGARWHALCSRMRPHFHLSTFRAACPTLAALLLFALPATAFAHEKWFTEPVYHPSD